MEEKAQFIETWHRNGIPLFGGVNIDMEIPAHPPPGQLDTPLHGSCMLFFSFFFFSFPPPLLLLSSEN